MEVLWLVGFQAPLWREAEKSSCPWRGGGLVLNEAAFRFYFPDWTGKDLRGKGGFQRLCCSRFI